jgi:hypothetical protein
MTFGGDIEAAVLFANTCQPTNQCAKHAAPIAIERQDKIRRVVSLSFRNKRPMMAAYTTLVSRSAETTPIASYYIAQMMIP